MSFSFNLFPCLIIVEGGWVKELGGWNVIEESTVVRKGLGNYLEFISLNYIHNIVGSVVFCSLFYRKDCLSLHVELYWWSGREKRQSMWEKQTTKENRDISYHLGQRWDDIYG